MITGNRNLFSFFHFSVAEAKQALHELGIVCSRRQISFRRIIRFCGKQTKQVAKGKSMCLCVVITALQN